MVKSTLFHEETNVFLQPSLTGRSTCGCNSSQNRSLRLLNCNSDHDGVFIVHYIRLIWDSCCVGKHMNAFAWTFGAINQRPCWFSGFQTMPSVNQHTVSFLTATGSSHVWQKRHFQMQRQITRAFFHSFMRPSLYLSSDLSHLQPVLVRSL